MSRKLFLFAIIVPGVLTSLSMYSSYNQHENLVNGLEVICDEVATEHVSILNIISAFSGHLYKDFCDSIMKLVMKELKFKIRQEDVDNLGTFKLQAPRKLSVIVAENYEQFVKILSELNNANFEIHGHFIVTLLNGKIAEIPQIFEEFWKRNIYNVIAVYEDSNVVIVDTFFPFRSSTDCSNTSPVTINRFENGSFIEGLDHIFIEKMNNLQQCQVKIATAEHAAPHISRKRLPNGQEIFHGRDYDLLEALAYGLNFKLNFTYVDQIGYIYPNGTAFGSLEKVLKNEADLSLGDWWLRLYRLAYYDATTSYISERLMFIIPYGREMTSVEKLMHPLTVTSWLVLIGFIICGFFVIFVTKSQSRKVQDFIIGEKVNYPYLNLAVALFGQTQQPLPKKNFARFLLMNFLLLSLVIRTAYQGKMFQIMKMNLKHSEVDSMDDIIDKGYDVLLPDIFVDYMVWRNFKYTTW